MILRRLSLASMRKQIFLLAVLPIFLLAAFAAVRGALREIGYHHVEWASFVAGHIPIIADEIRAAASSEQQRSVIEAAARDGLQAEMVERPIADALDLRSGYVDQRVFRDLVDRLVILSDAAPGTGAPLAVRIDEHRSILLRPDLPAFPSRPEEVMRTLGITSLVVLPVLLLSYYLSYHLTRPLIDFAAAARRISLDEDSQESFDANGAFEIRSLGNSLNVMQSRIRRMIGQRTALLRSIGHDLRTPLTRLRMRAERCPDAELQQAMLQDISNLSAMVDESMRYLGNTESGREPRRRIDLASLMQTIAADYADINITVSVIGPRRLVYTCMPRALTRALSNLIDNASRYGTQIELAYREDRDGDVLIEVRDDGPGLSDELKTRALEPFFKADTARTAAPRSGIGLGLPIANGMAKAHGGSLRLIDREPHGLIARLVLPADTEDSTAKTTD
ncbi:HAMP domain-containing protein [Ancylobacter sonchi]|uniref:sensor histidine kinase n=1 Tax=Ancylobacter sonchi TaxID=1937790 RepID=UPI001BD367D9|nr:ATP-binding protein [Ancylobacter sonchi]MBS7533784.1 HAMP domain-containing protein [Ancylobacter sonchi]